MARVTVEDCVTRVPNRFELVLLATQRSRQLSGGAELTVERENDRNPVIALREIADETVVVDDLRQSLITSLQKRVEIEGPEDDGMEILAAAGKEWAEVSGRDSIGTEPTGKATAAAPPAATPAAPVKNLRRVGTEVVLVFSFSNIVSDMVSSVFGRCPALC